MERPFSPLVGFAFAFPVALLDDVNVRRRLFAALSTNYELDSCGARAITQYQHQRRDEDAYGCMRSIPAYMCMHKYEIRDVKTGNGRGRDTSSTNDGGRGVASDRLRRAGSLTFDGP